MYKIVSIDEEKEYLPGYSPERADDFHVESAKNANKKFEQELKKIQNKKVILMCGGSASGKTEFIDKFCPTDEINSDIEGVVFDSTLSSENGAETKIRNIKKSGNIPIIYLVLPASLSRCFKAFHKRDRKIPETKFFDTHSGARKVALWIAKNYSDVEIFVFYNRLNLFIESDNTFISEDDLQITTKRESDFSFEEICFEGRGEMISFLENEQYSKEGLQGLILNNK